MKIATIGVVVIGMTALLGCGQAPSEEAAQPEAVVEQEAAVEPAVEARHDLMYVCACGPECDCGAAAVEPGECGCGKEMAKAHMLKMDGNVATVCSCAGDCTCELNAEDETMCSCGQPVKQVNLEGKGLYYCNCGGSCTCNHIASEPGECHCGMALVTS